MSESPTATATDAPTTVPGGTAEATTLSGQVSKCPKKRAFPGYTKSLLRIRVPVVVTLAEKKQQLDRILELGPGMIVHFNKSCDEMLELAVNNHRIAEGEVVKVGDKFGLRITNIVLPGEHFTAVGKAGNQIT
ncbi:MAG: FliM/FliN family flagellar motor switch protein [Pirellulales bacterium]|nr:FliM/FliN family flagellar motor switch protein [Pirellulales bacterium]